MDQKRYYIELYQTYLKVNTIRLSDLFKKNEKITFEDFIESCRPDEYKLPYANELLNLFNFNSDYRFEHFILNLHNNLNVLRYRKDIAFKNLVLKRSGDFKIIEKNESKKIDLLNLILEDKQASSFLNHNLREYHCQVICSSHPSGIITYGFGISYVIELNLLIFEILMEDAGECISVIIRKETISEETVINIIKQLINFYAYLENEVLVFHGDIKLNNLYINKEGNLKVIDYDLSQKISLNQIKSGRIDGHKLLGYTNGYGSPETYLLVHYMEVNLKIDSNKLFIKGNPWKSDVYSFGICGLLLLNGMKFELLRKIESYKLSEKEHSKIENFAKEIKVGDDKTSLKMQKLIEACLNFDPCRRPSFKALKEQFLPADPDTLDQLILMGQANEWRFEINNEGNPINQNSQSFSNNEKKLTISSNIPFFVGKNSKEFKNNVIKHDLVNAFKNIDEIPSVLSMKLSQNMHFQDSKNHNEENKEKKENIYKLKTENLVNIIPNQNLNELKSQNLVNIIPNQNIYEFKTEDLVDIIPDQNSLHSINLGDNNIVNSNPNINKEIHNSQVTNLHGVNYLNEAINFQNNKFSNLKKEEDPIMSYSIQIVNVREEVRSKIIREDFWYLSEMRLSKEEIFNVLQAAKQSKTLKGIDFWRNEAFDDSCAEKYFEVIKENKSFYGIDLCSLNISKDLKKRFFTIFSNKENIQYLVIDSKGINNEEAEEIAINSNLRIEDVDSEAFQFYKDYSFYYVDEPYWASKILFYSRKLQNN